MHKIYCFNHFKRYNSVALSTSTVLYSHHHCFFPELFHYPLLLPSPWLLVFYFVSIWVCLFLGTSYKWTHDICPFSTWFISVSIVFSRFIHPCCSMDQNFIHFYGEITFHRMHAYITFCLPFICWWTLGCFHLLALMNNTVHTGVHISLWISAFSSFYA